MCWPQAGPSLCILFLSFSQHSGGQIIIAPTLQRRKLRLRGGDSWPRVTQILNYGTGVRARVCWIRTWCFLPGPPGRETHRQESTPTRLHPRGDPCLGLLPGKRGGRCPSLIFTADQGKLERNEHLRRTLPGRTTHRIHLFYRWPTSPCVLTWSPFSLGGSVSGSPLLTTTLVRLGLWALACPHGPLLS